MMLYPKFSDILNPGHKKICLICRKELEFEGICSPKCFKKAIMLMAMATTTMTVELIWEKWKKKAKEDKDVKV